MGEPGEGSGNADRQHRLGLPPLPKQAEGNAAHQHLAPIHSPRVDSLGDSCAQWHWRYDRDVAIF
jgi:hypothetical protein